MKLQFVLAALLVSSVLAPAAMAKSASGLHIKNVPVKMRAAGKAKKGEKAVAAKPAKRARKGSKRIKPENPEI